jgi:hypothetical protein
VEQLSLYVDEHVRRRGAARWKVAIDLGLAVLLAAATLVAVNAAGSSARPLPARSAGKAGGAVPQSTGCTKTFTNPGPPALTACVSGHGNLNNLIYGPFISAVDHISNEGYCLRELNTGATYYDAGSAETGWGVATQSSTATTTTVTRTTGDGTFTLTQNIFFKYGSRLVLIGNLVKNNDTVSHQVVFDRYADIDMEATSGSDVFDAAGASVFAQQLNGIALTSLGNPALIDAFGAEEFGEWSSTGRSTCFTTLFSASVTGDYVAIMSHVTTLAPGATINFRVGYRLL